MTESTPEDVQEQRTSPTGDAPVQHPPTVPLEVAEGDAVEQAQAAAPGEHLAHRDVPLESDEFDAAEQAAVVELDEDEGRDA